MKKVLDKFLKEDDNNIVKVLEYNSNTKKDYGQAWSIRKDDQFLSILRLSQRLATSF